MVMVVSKLTIATAMLLCLGLMVRAASEQDKQAKRPSLKDSQPAKTSIPYKGKIHVVSFSTDGKSILTVGGEKKREKEKKGTRTFFIDTGDHPG
jgi:hypothetical protein